MAGRGLSGVVTNIVKVVQRTKVLRRKALRRKNSTNDEISIKKLNRLNSLRAHHSSDIAAPAAPMIVKKAWLLHQFRTRTNGQKEARKEKLLKKITRAKSLRRVNKHNKISIEVVEQKRSDVAALLADLKNLVIGNEDKFLVNLTPKAGTEDRWQIKEHKIAAVENILKRFPPVEGMRGSLGETVLHQCLVFMEENVPVLQALAHYFITRHPKLINMMYENKVFFGEVALHITIIKNQLVLFRTLIECGAKLNLRACGEFFLKFPQSRFREELVASKLMPRSVAMSIEDAHCVYLGEFILSFAACTGNIEMVQILLENGADITAQDTLGNTVLHVVVNAAHKYKNVADGAKMFQFLWKKGANIRRLNCEGFTPLALCAYHGNLELFGHIVKCYQTLIWNYGPVRCYQSPLADLDPAADAIARKPDKNNKVAPSRLLSRMKSRKKSRRWIRKSVPVQSVLELAMQRRHLDLLRHPMLTRLVEDKWKAFGRRSFMTFMAWLIFHCIMLIMVGSFWPSTRMQHIALTRAEQGPGILTVGAGMRADLSHLGDWDWVLYYSAGLIVSFDAVCLLVFVIVEIFRVGIKRATTGTRWLMIFHSLAILVSLSSFVLGITSGHLESSSGEQGSDWPAFALDFSAVACSVALISGGLFLLANLRGLKRLGALITMLSTILKRDFSRFLPIYGVLVVSYAVAFRVVYCGSLQMTPDFKFPDFMDLFSSSMGQEIVIDWQQAGPTVSQIYCKYFLFFTYSLCTTILAMNLLIGMLSDSFSKMWEISEKVSWLQRAVVIQHYARLSDKAWAKFVRESPAYSSEKCGICITTQEEKIGWGSSNVKSK